MTLLHPWALLGLLLALPVIGAYLYRLHKDKRAVSSAILVRLIRDERPASRRARSRIRHKLSLILVLVALVAGIVALVGPRAGAGGASRIVIVLDRSASMAARETGGDRLSLAAREIEDMVERMGDGDEIALVATGGEANIEIAPTRNRGDVIAALRNVVRAGAGGDNHSDALAFRLADGLCTDREHTVIVVVSDGAGLAPPATKCTLQSIAIGTDVGNVGITGLSARALDGLGGHDVYLAVGSTHISQRHVEITLVADGSVVDVIGMDIPAHGDAERTVRLAIERGRSLTATISDTTEQAKPSSSSSSLKAKSGKGSAAVAPPRLDALELDDRAEVGLSDAGPVSVLLVTTRKNTMVGEALRLHPRVNLAIAQPGALPKTPVDLIVLEDEPRAELPPTAHVVALGVSPGATSPIELGKDPATRTVVRWDFDSPWFRYVDLRDMVIGKGRLVAGGRSVVDTSAGMLVAKAAWGTRELLVTGFSLDETDLSLRAAFPNLIANLVDWAAPPSAKSPARGLLSAAETHVTPSPLGAPPVARPARWRDGAWLARIALLVAIGLLLVEQALYVRRQST
ncbi:MAG: VWA domain-containing protein [Deltaproteobacteria bacterium]|nr:VWA domain-containing protein [Deltaproteobacteria bacterium]